MIEMGKSYRTRDGREVRIYATDGGGDYPVHGAILKKNGWAYQSWTSDGQSYITPEFDREDDLIPSDPHGILPRHRELLADSFREVYGNADMRMAFFTNIESEAYADLAGEVKAALIALAKLDNERGGV